jgi:glutamate-1-semialdehyde aminotransferase
MRTPDSATTRLDDYLMDMLPWAHGHQRKAIRDFVQAIIAQQTGCQAQLASTDIAEVRAFSLTQAVGPSPLPPFCSRFLKNDGATASQR